MTGNAIITAQAITMMIIRDGAAEMVTVEASHPSFDKIRDAVKEKDWDRAWQLSQVRRAVAGWVASEDGEIRMEGDRIFLGDRAFSDQVSQMALAMMQEGTSADAMHNFLRRVRRNPSFAAQEELLLFIEANGFLIDEDGFIIAFRGVTDDYLDLHPHLRPASGCRASHGPQQGGR